MSTVNDDGRRPSMKARVRLADLAKHGGFPLPPEYRTSKPVVTWRRKEAGCRCRLLRLFLAPDGWHLLGDDYRVHPRTWLEWITGDEGELPTLDDGTVADLDARDAGKVGFANLRNVRGMDERLPLDLAEWPRDGLRFSVGCKHGGWMLAPLAWLAEDARRARDTRKPVTRFVIFPPDPVT